MDDVERARAEREEVEKKAAAATARIDENASFGIDEGEVDLLEKKWITW